jgi:hypothetical protein
MSTPPRIGWNGLECLENLAFSGAKSRREWPGGMGAGCGRAEVADPCGRDSMREARCIVWVDFAGATSIAVNPIASVPFPFILSPLLLLSVPL